MGNYNTRRSYPKLTEKRAARNDPDAPWEEKGACMMPLVFADVGEEQIIKKVGGSQEMKQHLADMGFVPGGGVTVVSTIGGNVIVKVKESRVAISREMAQKIFV